MKRKRQTLWSGLNLGALAILAGLATACDDSATNSEPPDMVEESQLDFVPLRGDAPPLETMDTTFWAVKGEERDLEIRFQGQGGPGTGQKFLVFEVEEQTLLRRPDGTQFAEGDSIEIRVVIDPEFYIASFEPSGLTFNQDEPAKLKIEYDEAEDEFLEREQEFELWRQENPGDPWERIGTIQIEELDEIEALLFGFTRYALAVGR
jgi:hypothetical protein